MLWRVSIGVTTRVASSLRRSAGVKRISWLVLTLGLFVPSVASADGFRAGFFGTGGSHSNNGSHSNMFAGQNRWDTGAADFLSFCLQLDSPLRPEQYFDTSMPSHISAYEVRAISYLATKNFSSTTTNLMAVGLQRAIWNALYDTDHFASRGGSHWSTSNPNYFADSFLSDLLVQKLPFRRALFLNSFPGTRGTDQVTHSTPEPGTLLLLGTGALALAARRRMAKKTN